MQSSLVAQLQQIREERAFKAARDMWTNLQAIVEDFISRVEPHNGGAAAPAGAAPAVVDRLIITDEVVPRFCFDPIEAIRRQQRPGAQVADPNWADLIPLVTMFLKKLSGLEPVWDPQTLKYYLSEPGSPARPAPQKAAIPKKAPKAPTPPAPTAARTPQRATLQGKAPAPPAPVAARASRPDNISCPVVSVPLPDAASNTGEAAPIGYHDQTNNVVVIYPTT